MDGDAGHDSGCRPAAAGGGLSPLFMMLATTAALGLSIGIFTPLIASRLEARGVGPLVNGLTGTVMYLAIGIGALVAGRLVDAVGAKRTFLAGACGVGLTAAAFPLFTSLAAWFVMRGFCGLFAALFFVSTEVAVALVGDPGRRARSLAYYGVAFSVGFSTGAGIWPLLERLGEAGPFLVTAGVCAGAALLGLGLFPDVAPPKRGRLAVHRPPPRLGAPLVTGFSFGFCEAVFATLMPVFGARVGYTDAGVGWFFVTVMVATLVGHIPIGMAADRIGPMRLTRAAAMVAICGVSLPLVLLSTATLTACCILAGFGIGCLYTLGLAEVGRRVDPERIAAANAAFTASYGVGSVLGPLAGGLLMITIGPLGFFVTLGACLVVLAVVSLASREVQASFPSTVPSRTIAELSLIDDWS